MIVLEWDRQRVVVAEGDVAGSKTSFRSARIIELHNDGSGLDMVAQRLREWFPASSKTPLSVSLILPREQVTFHRIELPLVADSEIPDMIRLQASMRLTVPVETVCLDFAPLPLVAGRQTRDVLLVTTPQEQLNHIRRFMASRQIELSEVRVSSFCIAAAAAQAGLLTTESDPDVLDILVLMRNDVLEITFVRGTSVVFAHSGASWSSPEGIEKAVRSELNRARMAATESVGEYRVGRLLLLGSPENTSAVSDQFASRSLQVTIERIDPAAAVISGELPSEVTADSLVAVAGAIASRTSRVIESVDLINPRKAPVKRDLRRVKILAGTLAAVLVVGLLWNWRQNRLAELQASLDTMNTEVSDIRSTLSRGKQDLELGGIVGQWVARDINWLDEMVQLNQLLPGTERVLIRNYTFASKIGSGIGTIRIDGTAKAREDVEALARRLDAAGYLVNPYTPGEARVSGPYPIAISLLLTIPERTPQKLQKNA